MTTTILRAIVGDTIGPIYEFNPTKDYNFELFFPYMEITDDNIMTIAVADWLLHYKLNHSTLAETLRYWGNKYRYPLGGYGTWFGT